MKKKSKGDEYGYVRGAVQGDSNDPFLKPDFDVVKLYGADHGARDGGQIVTSVTPDPGRIRDDDGFGVDNPDSKADFAGARRWSGLRR